MSDNETVPPGIEVDPTPAKDMIGAAVRNLVVMVGFATTMAGFASRHDLSGFIAYTQSSDFASALALLATVGAFLWSQRKALHRWRQLFSAAASPQVPDEVLRVKGAVSTGIDAGELATQLKKENGL